MIALLALLAAPLWAQVLPCSTYSCDSLAVRAILDANGLSSTSVDSISSESGNRMYLLDLSRKNLQTLPPDIGKVNRLRHLYLNSNELIALPKEIKNLTSIFSCLHNATCIPFAEGLQVGRNRLCNLPQDIQDWLDSNRLEQFTDWRSSQDCSNKALKVVWPNGGESLTAGSNEYVDWVFMGPVDSVRLEYSVGSDWLPIKVVAAKSGEYRWTVPNMASAFAKIRILETAGILQDESDNFFAIKGGGLAIHSGKKSPINFDPAPGGFSFTHETGIPTTAAVFNALGKRIRTVNPRKTQ